VESEAQKTGKISKMVKDRTKVNFFTITD